MSLITSAEQYKKDKLKGFSHFTEIRKVVEDPRAIFLPEVSMHTWEGLEVQIHGVVTPFYDAFPEFNKVLMLYATVPGDNQLAGYLGDNLHQSLDYHYHVEHSVATSPTYKGIATTLEAANQFLLKNIAAYTDIEIGTSMNFRSYDENSDKLKDLETQYKSNPSQELLEVLDQRREQRKAWLRLYGNGGLLGFERAYDDDKKIVRSITVSRPEPSLANASRIILQRDNKESLYDSYSYEAPLERAEEIRRMQFERILEVQLP